MANGDQMHNRQILLWTMIGAIAGTVGAIITLITFFGYPTMHHIVAAVGLANNHSAEVATDRSNKQKKNSVTTKNSSFQHSSSDNSKNETTSSPTEENRKKKTNQIGLPDVALADGTEYKVILYPQDDILTFSKEYTIQAKDDRTNWATFDWSWRDRSSSLYLGLRGPNGFGDLDNIVLNPKDISKGKTITLKCTRLKVKLTILDVASGPDNPKATRPYESVFYKLAFNIQAWEL